MFLVWAGMVAGAAGAVVLHQVDDFQMVTVAGWSVGAPHPQPPTVVLDEGPFGVGDHHLLLQASGVAGPGGRLAVFERDRWTGDYPAAGVTGISVRLRNVGSSPLTIRLAVDGAGGRFATAQGVDLAPFGLWTAARFSLVPADLAADGGTDAAATLAAVSELRLVNSVAPSFRADVAAGALAIDDITAVPEPRTATILLLALPAALARRRRRTSNRP